MPIHDNVQNIQRQIGPEITLVAAVKYTTKDHIMEAVDAGIKDIGFNTFQQMEEIAPLLPKGARTHFIGTLQKNKVNKVIDLNPYLIQSVDSYDLAKKIDTASQKRNKIQDILIQIKTDKEKDTGVLPEDMGALLRKISHLKNIKIAGLMTIPPYDGNPDNSRPYFRAMKSYFNEAEKILEKKLKYLSMGMSGDYMAAIEEGANMIRLGDRIFVDKRI